MNLPLGKYLDVRTQRRTLDASILTVNTQISIGILSRVGDQTPTHNMDLLSA
jgi:hypothetical protein